MVEQRGAAEERRSLAVLGGTGPSGAPFLDEFVNSGVPLRVLARDPARVAQRAATLEVIEGSMMSEVDVGRAIHGAGTVFLLTPLGNDDDTRGEVRAAVAAIAAAKVGGRPQLVYVSVIGVDEPTGVAAMDVKKDVERRLAESGLPWSSLRAGGYMEDNFDRMIRAFRSGVFVSLRRPDVRTHYTAQRDLARAALVLHRDGRALDAPVEVFDPTAYADSDVIAILEGLLGRKLRIVPSAVTGVLMSLARPMVKALSPKGATVLSIVRYLSTHSYLGRAGSLEAALPGLQATTLTAHLRALLEGKS